MTPPIDPPTRSRDLLQEKTRAQALLRPAIFVQFIGVTAALVGVFAVRTGNDLIAFFTAVGGAITLDSDAALASMASPFAPVALAYSLMLPTALFGLWVSRVRTALGFVYWALIMGDTILLAWLVHVSGGIHENLFFPLFVLIPSVATCYCRRKWFLVNICAAVGIVIMLILSDSGGSAATRSSAFSASHASEILTCLCIVTAALCHCFTREVVKSWCRSDPYFDCDKYYY